MTRSKARLWLVRHAAPLVPPGTCYGALDVPADTAATQIAAMRLAAALPSCAAVFHSPLQRCEQLGMVIQGLRPDLASKPDPRLREMDFGAWEGQAWNAIAKSAIDAWTAAFATHAPGGGESLAVMLERVASALTTARQWHTEQAVTDVVWITHAGVARCVHWLLAHESGVLPQADEWPVTAPGWGEWEIRTLG